MAPPQYSQQQQQQPPPLQQLQLQQQQLPPMWLTHTTTTAPDPWLGRPPIDGGMRRPLAAPAPAQLPLGQAAAVPAAGGGGLMASFLGGSRSRASSQGSNF